MLRGHFLLLLYLETRTHRTGNRLHLVWALSASSTLSPLWFIFTATANYPTSNLCAYFISIIHILQANLHLDVCIRTTISTLLAATAKKCCKWVHGTPLAPSFPTLLRAPCPPYRTSIVCLCPDNFVGRANGFKIFLPRSFFSSEPRTLSGWYFLLNFLNAFFSVASSSSGSQPRMR